MKEKITLFLKIQRSSENVDVLEQKLKAQVEGNSNRSKSVIKKATAHISYRSRFYTCKEGQYRTYGFKQFNHKTSAFKSWHLSSDINSKRNEEGS